MQRGKINSDMETSESWMKNTFLLRRLSINSNSPSVQVDFSPINKPEPSSCAEHPSDHNVHTFPVFNFDSCYYTPSFILEVDKSKYVANASSYQSLHESKKEELSVQKTQLYVPKPSKTNSYCCICKTLFDDYLTHVNIPKHQQLMHGSEFTQSINDLCHLFNQEEVESKSKKNKPKSKKIEKAEKPKRKYRKDMNLTSMSTSTNLDDSLQSRRKEIIVV